MSELSCSSLSRPGCEVYYGHRPSESGRWAVFFHGAGMDNHMFDSQCAALPPDMGIASWDARGHGRSQRNGRFRYADMLADARALIDELGAEDLTIIGQSMGGNLAQSLADDAPPALKRLVLIDCTDNHGPLGRGERLALRSLGFLLKATPWSFIVAQSAKACGCREGTAAYARGRLLDMGKVRFIEVMSFWADVLQPDPDYRFGCPVLALVGERDGSGNIGKAMQGLSVRDTGVTHTVIADAAHNANMDAPGATNTALAAFLT